MWSNPMKIIIKISTESLNMSIFKAQLLTYCEKNNNKKQQEQNKSTDANAHLISEVYLTFSKVTFTF